MRSIGAKNNKDVAHNWCGQTIQPDEYYWLLQTDWIQWQNNTAVLEDIESGDLIINNGVSDITDVTEAKAYLQAIETTLHGSENELLTRPKYAVEGWHMHKRMMDFTTATIGSLVNMKWDGTDFGDATLRFFNTDLTTEYTTNPDITNNCCVTVIDWEIPHDLEALGGRLKLKVKTSGAMRVYCIVAPDIPEVMGGCKAFASNINTEFCDSCELDGKTPKYVAYDDVYHSGKFRYVFRHSVGDNIDVQFGMELFEE